MEDERVIKSAKVNYHQPLVPILPLDCVTKTVHIYKYHFENCSYYKKHCEYIYKIYKYEGN